jgi:hypothetical protein
MSKRNGATNGHTPEAATVDLNGLERVLLLQVLPAEASLLTIRILHDFRQVLALSDDELAVLGVKDETPITYDALAAITAKPIEIGAVRRDLIVAGLRVLDKAQKVGMQHLSLFEKFPVEPDKGAG